MVQLINGLSILMFNSFEKSGVIIYLLIKMSKAEHTIDDYTILCVIGSGLFGKVLLVKEVKTGDVFAMKVVKKKLIENQNKLQNIFTERNLLIELKHPFIIKIVNSFQSEKKFYFILEYCHGGELYNLLSIKEKFTEEQAKFYISQVILAIDFLHQNDVVYRDLKPENILIDRYGFIKLTDFGLSKKMKKNEEKLFSMSGMPEYMAPEILFQKQCNKAVDFWCLGSLLFEMVTGYPPFYSQNLNQLYESIKFQEFEVDEESELTPECVNLLKGLFIKDPNQRLGMKGVEEIKSHPWFNGIDWKLVIGLKYRPPFIPILKSEQDTTYFGAVSTNMSVSSVGTPAVDKERQVGFDEKYFSGFDFNSEESSQT